MIAIKNIQMPGTCAECPLPYFRDLYIVCPLIDRVLTFDDVCYTDERQEDCPLIEVTLI